MQVSKNRKHDFHFDCAISISIFQRHGSMANYFF